MDGSARDREVAVHLVERAVLLGDEPGRADRLDLLDGPEGGRARDRSEPGRGEGERGKDEDQGASTDYGATLGVGYSW